MQRRVSNGPLRWLDVGRAAETLRVRDARERKVFGENVKFLERPIKEIDLLVQRRVAFGGERIGEIDESGDNSVAVDGFAFRKCTDLVPSDQARGRQQDEDPDKRGD